MSSKSKQGKQRDEIPASIRHQFAEWGAAYDKTPQERAVDLIHQATEYIDQHSDPRNPDEYDRPEVCPRCLLPHHDYGCWPLDDGASITYREGNGPEVTAYVPPF